MSDDMTTVAPVEGAPSRRKMLAGMGVAAGGGLLALAGTQSAQATVSDSSYYSYGPYRYVDSRSNSGGRISGGVTRNLPVFSGLQDYTFACNVTVVGTQGAGFLAIYNADLGSRPTPYSTINWMTSGQVVANFTMLDLGAAGANVFCSGGASTSTHFIIDVVGLFITNGAAAKALPASFKAWEAKAKRQLAQ
jgi:hypothetical protein